MWISKVQCLSVFLMFLIVLPAVAILGPLSIERVQSTEDPKSLVSQESEIQVSPDQALQDVGSLSETFESIPSSGEIDPIPIEQTGYSVTGNVSARTDTMQNTANSLEIDSLHDWVASETNATVTNLKRLYIVNGSLDEGLPGVNVNPNGSVSSYPYGWTSDSYSSDANTIQRSEYIQGQNSFVGLENEGDPTGTGANTRFQHGINTRISWAQTIDNRPYTEDFVFSLRFLYLNGPLDSSLGDSISLEVWMNGTRYWNQSLAQVGSRDIWYSSGVVNISLAGAPNTFEFDVRLAINTALDLYPTEYGFLDSNYLTVLIDDIDLIGQTPPTSEQVNMIFNAGGASAAVTDSIGYGTCIISNSSYWSSSSLQISFDSNSTISFDYNVKLLNHRFIYSSSTTDTLDLGVAYEIESGNSGNLEIYTYLGYSGIYEDLVLKIFHPSDWENFTVYDPFLSDVSSSCTFSSNVLTIPEFLLDRLGWWKVACDTPNYAYSAEVERYDAGIPAWTNESIFHSFDSARLSVSIGTAFETPVISDPVNYTWAFPNSTVWSESSSSGGLGLASSSPVIFGQTNTTAGIWVVCYLWSNGTELAYHCYKFALHHTAELQLVFSDSLSTVVGQPVTVVLRFFDNETGKYLVNDGASIVGHWDGPDVLFTADIVNNWWQADFETTFVGAGDFTVSLVSAAPYYETDLYEITIHSQFLTSLVPPVGPLTPLTYGREYSYDFFYSMSYNGTGIEGATVEITEEGSEWATVSDVGGGHYNLTLIPLASRDYSIRIRFSKVGFENQTHVLSFLVNDVHIEVDSISALSGPEYAPLTINVHIVESDTRNPVTGANVTLAVFLPGDYLVHDTTMNETTPGTYSTTIIMFDSTSGPYTVKISVDKENHELIQSFSSTLVPTFDFASRMFRYAVTYPREILILAIFIIGAVVGQRVRRRRHRESRATALAFKNRINDANNILGFLVLHKLSGVPIYSKVFKGGFEEGMISAFITAIMHFREGFETGGKSDTFTLIPLSEVIRIVPTQNLICAFITVTPPSFEQERKMISYARAIGMMFDDTLSQPSGEVIDAKTSKTFEWMLDDILDTLLIRDYQNGVKKYPRPLRFIEKAIPIEEREGRFNLYRLVRLLTSTTDSEYVVYNRVFEALEGEYILPIYPYDRNDLAESG
ncbi:MAG: hypothetical protein ACFFF9_03780 [Candidatus Thorarchaeota archaeon]